MKLCLGTVQFGLNYGIENKKVEKQEIEKIFEIALDNNIVYLDTAQAYGNAEEIIGNFSKREEFKIISKLSSTSLKNFRDIKELEKNLQNSLQNLKVCELDAILLHNTNDIKNIEFIENLLELGKKGYFKYLGVSIYTPDEAEEVLKNEKIKYIQVPYNILDTRLDKINFFERAHKNDKVIFVRSIFLQGTLLKEHYKYPDYLEELKLYDSLLNEEVERLEINKVSFLLNFLKLNKNIDYIVFGIENYNQLLEIIKYYKSEELNNYDFYKFRKKFKDIPEKILNPSLWRK